MRYDTKWEITHKVEKKLDELDPAGGFHDFRRTGRALNDSVKQILGCHHENYYSFLMEVAAGIDDLTRDEWRACCLIIRLLRSQPASPGHAKWSVLHTWLPEIKRTAAAIWLIWGVPRHR